MRFDPKRLTLLKMGTEVLIKAFSELKMEELYGIMVLRQEVFVVEQTCAYLDADGFDPEAIHLFFKDPNDGIIAYARIIPPPWIYKNEVSIGRVVVKESHRKKGLGRQLMELAIKVCREQYREFGIKISAQTYLEPFYVSMGFNATGEKYLEDGIPHMRMKFQYWD